MNKLCSEYLFSIFRELVKHRYGIEENFEIIENEMKKNREGDCLTYNQLEVISDRTYWPFLDFWMWPCKEQIEHRLKETKSIFIGLPLKEELVINRLLEIFKNIALVSIILRFVVPEEYGIYSRPPLYAMQVERGRTDTEEYLNYLRDLRLIKRSLGTNKAAEADMFVWAIAHRPDLLLEFNRKMAEFLPKNIAFKDLINCLQDNPLKISIVFKRKGDYQTAGFWAAKAFEKFLENECRKYPYEIMAIPKTRADKIDKLTKLIPIWRDNKQLLLDTKNKYRNRIIPGTTKFTEDEVSKFIKNIQTLNFISAKTMNCYGKK